MRNRKPNKKLNIAEMDQAAAIVTNHVIPLYASTYRAFLKEEGIDQQVALVLTMAYMSSAQNQR